MSRQLEFRLDADAIRPLVAHVMNLIDSAQDELLAPNAPPVEDELMSGFWSQDLLSSQRKDIAAISELFDDDFLESGKATVDEEDVDLVLRGCAAIRLKIRETTLSKFSDHSLERGELDQAEFGNEERDAYGAYILFASLQELIISQMDP